MLSVLVYYNFFHYVVLFMSILVGSSLDYWWIFWVSMELVLWSMMPLLFKVYEDLLSFVYWQSLSSLLFITLFIFMKFKLCLLLLMLKMSLPPFHIWFLNFLKNVSWMFFLLFIFITKIPYILLFSNFWASSILKFMVVFPLISFFYFWLMINVKYMLWIISISDYPWTYILAKSSHLMTVYLTLLVLLMLMLMASNISFKFIILMLFMTGLPPFSIFQIKMIISSMCPLLKMLLFLGISFLNHLVIWFYVFVTWFISALKTNKKYFLHSIYFLFINLLWLIF